MDVLYLIVGKSPQGHAYNTASNATQAVSIYNNLRSNKEWFYLYILRIDYTNKDQIVGIRLETD